MATNPHFSWFKEDSEKDLMDDLTVEYIQMYGYDLYYLPRFAVNKADVFGEDFLQRYPQAVQMEVYIENVEGMQGEGDLFAKFGVLIRDRITFTLARKRWEELQSTTYLEVDGAQWALPTRPNEEDLVFFPLVGKLFRVMHVEHEKLFYPLGRRTVYSLECELYEASSERIDTGVPEIDAIEDATSLDVDTHALQDESGESLLDESGEVLIDEAEMPESSEPLANNSLYQRSVDSVVDFSEWNPLSRKKQY